jgi:hypothetical protein
MVNKLSGLRKRKERVTEEYTTVLNESIVELRRENPMWTLQTIANAVGLTRERVRQVLNQEHMPTAAVRELPVTVLTCAWCNHQFERATRQHQRNVKRGITTIYCTVQCQRRGVGSAHSKRWGARTECGNGHPLVTDNLYVAPSSTTPRCRQCRAAYARKYYYTRKAAREAATMPTVERFDDYSLIE